MRGIFGNIGMTAIARGALAVALAGGLLAGGVGLGATAAFAKDSAPKAGGNSKEFVAAAGPIQKTLEAAKPLKAKVDASTGADKAAAQSQLTAALATAPAELAAVEAAAKTPSDKMIAGQWGVALGGMINDVKMRQRGIQSMLDSGLVPAANLSEYQFYLGNFAYGNKDYPTAVKALTPVVAANYKEDAAAELLADSYAQQGQNTQALDSLKAAVAARKAAGGAVPEDWFKRANLIAYKNKLGPQAIEWATLMVQNSPTAFNWLGAGQLVREFGNFTNQESLDLGRLLLRSGGLSNDPKYVEREYVEYIQAADPRRLPGEVVKVGEAGIAAGALRANDSFVTDAMTQARGRVAADKASLPGLARDAAAAGNGVGALATGDAYLSYGDAAKAEGLYMLAVQKGGVDKDRALTRLGIAQSDEGKYAEAKATFAQVGGPRAPLAKLWTIYVDQKAGGTAVH
ncbi:hypothetical protein [Novosphingobium lentum]|uniref:hypothetical protein n=1 Tax=Novosphingobium lentum TaxID=145287 RepID=UPI00082AE603|nr:hypothetical protein [Novosphingobium lentum]